MTRLDTIRYKHPSVVDGTTILVYDRDLRALLDLADATKEYFDKHGPCRITGSEEECREDTNVRAALSLLEIEVTE